MSKSIRILISLHSELSTLHFIRPCSITSTTSRGRSSFISQTLAQTKDEIYFLGQLLERNELPKSSVKVFTDLNLSYCSCSYNSKQSRIITNEQLNNQLKFVSSMISMIVQKQPAPTFSLSTIEDLSTVTTVHSKKKEQVNDIQFHLPELRLYVSGENSRNILEFKDQLRKVTRQCITNLLQEDTSAEGGFRMYDKRSLGILYDRNR